MNITGEQARLIAQTDAMVQQEQGRKWAEPQVEAPDMVEQPEPEPLLPPLTASRGGIEYVAVDPTREGAASHFTVQRDGRIQQHVDYTNMEASPEQFSGSLRQAVERATAQFNNLADVLIHTSERFR